MTTRYIVPDGPDIGREFFVRMGNTSEVRFCQWADSAMPFDYVESFIHRCRVEEPEGSATEIGRKDDSGKPTWRLLYTFLPELNGVVEVLEAGAKKYSPGNWEFVEDGFNRYGEAGRRHLLASLAGEERDPDSGSYHELHVIASMFFRLARRRLGR